MISSFLTRDFSQENLLPVCLNESSSLTSSHTYTEGHRESNEVGITGGVNEEDFEKHESQII